MLNTVAPSLGCAVASVGKGERRCYSEQNVCAYVVSRQIKLCLIPDQSALSARLKVVSLPHRELSELKCSELQDRRPTGASGFSEMLT